jgi:hypothetical protein
MSNTSDNDTQEKQTSCFSGAHQKFINNKFLECNSSDNKKKLRRNKKLFFEKERNEIVNNLIDFIDNTKDGEYIFVIDLQHNKQLIKYINDNVDNIKKWYRCSSWGYFVSENNNQQGDEITLLKSILKDHEYSIYKKDITADKYNEKKRYTTIKLIKE